MTEERDEQVLLAAALAVRAVRQGSTCVDLTTVVRRCRSRTTRVLPWPDVDRVAGGGGSAVRW